MPAAPRFSPPPDATPFLDDCHAAAARALEREGSWLQAAQLHQEVARRGPQAMAAERRAAHAFYRAGGHDNAAMELCRHLNRRQPTVQSLLLEARLQRRRDRTDEAVRLLRLAGKILQEYT